MKSDNSLVVSRGHIGCPSALLQVGVLGTDPRIVQTGGDALRFTYLAVFIFKDVRQHPVQDTLPPLRKRRRIPPPAGPPCLHPHELHASLLDEFVKATDSVATSSDARDDSVGKPPLSPSHLLSDLFAYYALKVPYNNGVGVGTDHRTDQVVGGTDVGRPVS